MFRWFKADPIKVLEKQYAAQLVVARDTQRKGDMRQFAVETEKAEELLARIQQLESDAATRLTASPGS
jgi:ABC-type Fe3+-hydroxamate transport system substrate-binding protein